WIEGNVDETTYEISHFLHLATHCNASILEVFKAPVVYEGYNTSLGYYLELRSLFPYVWNPQGVFDAFCGYSKNQETKFLNDHKMTDAERSRKPKYACAYLRTLYNLEQLLATGDFTLDVTHNPEFFKRLKSIRSGEFTIGDILNEAQARKKKCLDLLEKCNHKPDLDKVNDFLLKVRKD